MSTVKLVGILNVTPDSFSDGGQFALADKALAQAEQLLREGASIVDVGGEATNPSASPISPEQEWQRIETVLIALLKKYPGKVSLDSHHPATIKRAARHGEFIINDVTGFNDPAMRSMAAELQYTVIISHLPAPFGTDIKAAHTSEYPMDSIDEVARELLARQKQLAEVGLSKDKIILDPGIGFGKTMELNKQLLEFPAYIKRLDPSVKVMVGYSRKRFLGDNRMELEPNLAAGRLAIASGADYLRVHDVAAHRKLLAA